MPEASILLASTSRWRLSLLRDAGVPCEAVDPCVDESLLIAADPVELALLRATAKARAVARARPESWVLGADQVAHLDGESFGKPPNPDQHRAVLRALRGRVHRLSTGVVLCGPGFDERFAVHTDVRFRSELTDAEIDAYVASGEGRACAGGYMVERRGAWLIEGIEGDWTNVIGLPVFAVVAALRRRGWRMGVEAV